LFTKTPHDSTTMVVKRLAYLPGETVELKDGSIYKLEHNQYWVAGDNVERSFDSRHFGPIPHHMICGIVTGVIYPNLILF
jgi:signal peptidase I